MRTAAGLTPLEDRFAREYMIDLNATQAALRAGVRQPTPTSRAPSTAAHQMLKRPHVRAYIAEMQAAREARTSIDADWMLVRLAQEAMADLADLYDEHGALLPVHEWPPIWRQGLVAGIEIEEITAGEGEAKQIVGRVKKIRVSDRVKRLELLGKHVNVSAFGPEQPQNHLHLHGEAQEASPRRIAQAVMEALKRAALSHESRETLQDQEEQES